MFHKYFFISSLAITLVACQSHSQYFTLNGHVEGDMSSLEKITITSYDDYEKEIEINPDGTFKEVLTEKGAVYYFDSGSGKKMIYAHDRGTLDVVVKQNEKSEWKSQFSGDGAPDIDFIFEINNAMNESNFLEDRGVMSISKLDEEAYKRKVEEFRNEIHKVIEKKGSKEVSKEAKTAMMTELDATCLFMYNFYKYLRNKNYDKNGEIEAIIKKGDFDSVKSSNYMISQPYRQLTHGHWRRKARKMSLFEHIHKRVAFNQTVSEGIEDEKIRNAMIFYNTKRYLIRMEDDDTMNALKNSFMSASTNPIHMEFISNMYDQIVKTGKGRVAPVFENYENHEGELVSLRDLKGKNVYIDFWATWCAPCKKEFPHLKKIEKKYHDSNIVFVGISLDKESKKDAWRRMVGEEELSGIQLFADNSFDSAFAEAFQVSAIPRFVLIDKEGKIVSANAPRPSDEKGIDEIFKTLDL